MNFERILQRALHVVFRYRALWVLGFIWALVGGAGSGGSGFQASFGGGGGGSGSSGSTLGADLSSADAAAIAGIVVPLLVAACCVILALIVVTTIVRYVVMVGVMRSLDQLERDGVEPSVRRAWSEGWNRRTWRPFLQNILVGIPLAILFVLTLLPVAAPLILAATGEESAIAVAIAAMCGLFCLWLLAVIVISTVVGVLQQLWWRAAVLDDADFVSALAAGWRLARANTGHLVMAWLVMLVVGLVWFAITITLGIALGLLAGVVAGVPALVLFGFSESAILAGAVGIPIFLVVFGVPMTLAQGLFLVFEASVWNQIYRALPRRDTIVGLIPASDPA